MAAAGGGTAECFDPTAVCPKDLPGDATRKKATAKPMACRLFAKRCILSVFFISFRCIQQDMLGFALAW